jgi:LysM repeat protein
MKKSIFTLLIANITLVGFGQNQKIHTVGPKETFYSIARLYDIPPKELMKVNPKYAPDYKLNPTDRLIIHTDQTEVENQLKNLAEVAPPIQNQNQTSTHTVAKGQTLYSLARLYNIDAKELMRLNPKYGPTYSLKVKDVISLTANTSQMMPTAQKEEQLEVKKEVKNTAEIKTENAIHKVEQGQTLYSIARMYDIHPKELMALNPSFGPKYSLKVNDKIAIVSSDKLSSVEQTSSVEATKTKERRGKTAAIPKR